MKRFAAFLFWCLCLVPAAQAVPDAVTDLTVSATGFRHVTLTWTTPYDGASAACPSFYDIRLSSPSTDWDSAGYRSAISTSGVIAGERVSCTVAGLVNGQEYYFAIKSSTDNLHWSAVDVTASSKWTKPSNIAPGAVGGYNYANNVIVTTDTPAFSWTAPTDAGRDADYNDDALYGDAIVSYNIELSRHSDFSSSAGGASNVVSTDWTVGAADALDENTTYYWRVWAFDSAGAKSSSAMSRSFIVNAVSEPPTVPSLQSPAPGELVNSFKPTFQWSAAADPDPEDSITYAVAYSTSADFAACVTTTVAGITGLQYQPAEDLVENVWYYWNVAAQDSSGLTTTSTTTFTFAVNTVNSPPLSFALTGPSADAIVRTATPALSWEPTLDPDPGDSFTYIVYYSSQDPVLVSYTTEVAGLTTTGYTLPALQEDATYWWKVRADDGTMNIETETRAFTVNAVDGPPSAFDLVASSGIVSTALPLFDWQDAADPDGDAVRYALFYSTAADFSMVVSSIGLTTSEFVPPSAFPENAVYYWKVEAYDMYGNTTTSSQSWQLVIDALAEAPDPFDLVTPADHSVVSLLNPFLDWQDTVDRDPGDSVQSYELYYSTCADFAVQSVLTGLTVSSCTLPSALGNGTTYYWKVKAVATVSGETFSSSMRSFCAFNRPPNAFSLIASSGVLAAATPQLVWQSAVDPDGDSVSYTVYYSSYADFSFAVSSAGLPVSSYTVAAALEENRACFWYAEAVDSCGNKRAANQVFTMMINMVNEPPQAFALGLPADGSVVNTFRPALSWDAATDPDPLSEVTYTLWYSTDAGFAVKNEVTGLTAPSYRIAANLAGYTTYFWKVIAISNDGFDCPSVTRSFCVTREMSAAAPANFRAVPGSDRKTCTLTWDAVTLNEDGSSLTNLAGYRIYRSYGFADLFTRQPSTTVPAGIHTWTDNEAEGETVYYLVRAYNDWNVDGLPSAVQKCGTEQATLLYNSDLTAVVNCPADILSSTMAVTLLRGPAAKDATVLGTYLLSVNGDYAFRFSRAITLTFSLGTAFAAQQRAAGAEPSYGIFWHNGVEWVYLGGEQSGTVLTVRTQNAGTYQVRQTARSAAFKTLTAWPKIITPNGDGVNDEFNYTFEKPSGETADGTIFDVSGARAGRMTVKTDTWLAWDGTDESGGRIKPGVYIYQVRCGDKIANGTVVVAR